MNTKLHNAYMALKDALFDLMMGAKSEAVGRAAEWLLVHLPETEAEREMARHLFG